MNYEVEERGGIVTFLCSCIIVPCTELSRMQKDNDFLNDVNYIRSPRFERWKFECLSVVGGKSADYEIYENDYLKFLRTGLSLNGEAFNGKELIGDQFVKSAEKVENGDLKLLQSPFDESDEMLKIDEGLNEELQNEDSDDDDPPYKFFLSHVKGNGKSFTFETKEVNGLNKIIEYQKEEPMYDRQNRQRNRNMNNTLERRSKRKRTWTEPQSSKDLQRSCLRSLSIEKSKTPSHKQTSGNRTFSRFHPKSDKDGLGKLGVELWDESRSVGNDVMIREQDSLVEEDYQCFLTSFKSVNGRTNLPLGSNKKLICDGGVCLDNVSCYEVKKSRTTYSKINNVVDDICCHMPEGCETAAVKEKVMAILRKPFNEQEYKKLWHDVTKRNYISRHKELEDRNEKTVTTRHKGKSYLKRYKAVRRELEAVRGDKCKRLNILRGFVFYLEHLGWGEFKPWEDPSCLAVMPGSH
ncbi:hypothetical protein LIER_01485 [Lithospermum erythrorhizon]|uniref:Uncharacterized protein n=1 Tax=Lithospermum erythrorhizon TaxID=34254 RepID=A0AAV3NNG1_LITER